MHCPTDVLVCEYNGDKDGFSQMCSPLSLSLASCLSPLRPNLSPEESHGDEPFNEWLKMILRSCLDWLRLDTAVVIRGRLLMGKWWL